jgi:hypothetical protein
VVDLTIPQLTDLTLRSNKRLATSGKRLFKGAVFGAAGAFVTAFDGAVNLSPCKNEGEKYKYSNYYPLKDHRNSPPIL